MEPTPPGPTPIPVEGDVQVFADPECTRYPSGEVNTVYVRINVPWVGMNSGWVVGDFTDAGSCFVAISPNDENPDDPYVTLVYNDYFSAVEGPYTAGQVVEAYSPVSNDVTNYQKVFTRP